MGITAINVRNQFRGKVKEIIEGPVTYRSKGGVLDYESLLEDAERCRAEAEGCAYDQRRVDAAVAEHWADRAKRAEATL